MSASRPLLAAVAVLVCLGCSSESSAPQPANSGAATSPDLDDAAPSPSATGTQLVLAPDGLMAVDPQSGAARALGFGAPQPQILAALTRLRGAPRDQGLGEECGAGPLAFASWDDGLILWFQDNRFAGWALNRGPAASTLTTASGIGLNVPRNTAEQSVALDVEQTTLGTEFSAGGLGGILDGPASDARITALWAGVTCMFR